MEEALLQELALFLAEGFLQEEALPPEKLNLLDKVQLQEEVLQQQQHQHRVLHLHQVEEKRQVRVCLKDQLVERALLQVREQLLQAGEPQ